MGTQTLSEVQAAGEEYDKKLSELYQSNLKKAQQAREMEGDLQERTKKQAIKMQKRQGDFVQECKQWFDVNPRPFKLGKCYCFFYNKETNEPRIVLGPDWIFSLIEVLVINGICGYFLITTDTRAHPIIFEIGLVMLLLQNIAFLSTVLVNPGLAPRDISIHS